MCITETWSIFNRNIDIFPYILKQFNTTNAQHSKVFQLEFVYLHGHYLDDWARTSHRPLVNLEKNDIIC
jgi:hypothetical protein